MLRGPKNRLSGVVVFAPDIRNVYCHRRAMTIDFTFSGLATKL